MITQERLKELLSYDPETGLFVWVKRRKGVTVGNVAGHINKAGYVTIKIDQSHHMAHRLAWLFMTGSTPENMIDHRDRSKSNNKFLNLREATNKQNIENAKTPSTNKSGFKGVFLTTNNRYPNKPYIAKICHHGKYIHIGNYATAEDADVAYRLKRDELFTHHKPEEIADTSEACV